MIVEVLTHEVAETLEGMIDGHGYRRFAEACGSGRFSTRETRSAFYSGERSAGVPASSIERTMTANGFSSRCLRARKAATACGFWR